MVDAPETPKGEGRGRGRWTERGVQATQASDIEALKTLVAEMAARLDDLEDGGTTDETGGTGGTDTGGTV